ncbi:hypothetical protein MBM_08180 [Drepanopeziza brunnea f. sp. 'multigermtubi' MB_m1]|uniref:Uncharacterized protein n=1 Tax=Marssonina brunnea f. sp. multigermtubi (strain MB_m1) TaxID=1072389 RepID=K1WMA3_MARBU|nr:uncharacterized protein MBM_08180 [Drepanopeziza brunnea f. sp. 'multigermtubi' MB_m1]EKD13462.1 hypothetical protein MBM_08180 [Drepanopeziza brunnea f. sp. 'multigermtubi' MB_m1]
MLRPASSHDAMSTGARRDVQADGMRNIYASHNAVTALTSSRADIYPRRSNEMIFSAAPVPTTAEQERTMQMVAKQWSGATEENHDLQNRPLDGQVRSSGHDGRFKRARDLLPSDDEPAKRARYNSNALRSPSPGIYTSFPYGLPRPEEASHHDHGHGQPSEAMSEATAVPDPGDFDKTAGVPRAAAHHPHHQGHTHLRRAVRDATANAEFRAPSTAMTAFMDTWQGGAANADMSGHAGYDRRPYGQQRDRSGGGSMPGVSHEESLTDAPVQQGFAEGLSPAPLNTGRDVGTASRRPGDRGYGRQDFASGGAGGQPGFGHGDLYEQQVFGGGPDHDPGYNTILSGGYLPSTGMSMSTSIGMGAGMGNYAAQRTRKDTKAAAGNDSKTNTLAENSLLVPS